MNIFAEAAPGYAADGTPVFPLAFGGKTPLTRNGFKAATTDPDRIERWCKCQPDANIGVAIPPGFLVIDVDSYKADAARTITELESTLGLLPAGPAVRTGSGGLHCWFTVDTDRCFRAVAGPGVDLRVGGKHYVVAPPSRLAGGGRYEWLSTDEEAEPPKLPLPWIQHLTAPVTRLSAVILVPSFEDIDAWLDDIPGGDDPMDDRMAAAVGSPSLLRTRMRTAAHDTMIGKVYRVVLLAIEGHPGAYRALSIVQRLFLDEMQRRHVAGLPGRDAESALHEFQAAAIGAAERIAREVGDVR